MWRNKVVHEGLALNITTKLNAPHFVVESDSKICIESIRAPIDQVPWGLLSFVSAINSISIDLGYVSFSWAYVRRILAAHELAEWSRSHWPPSVVDVIVKEADSFV